MPLLNEAVVTYQIDGNGKETNVLNKHISYPPDNIEMLIIGRLFLGFGVGYCNQVRLHITVDTFKLYYMN